MKQVVSLLFRLELSRLQVGTESMWARAYLFYLSKYYEFLDTVLLVLTKVLVVLHTCCSGGGAVRQCEVLGGEEGGFGSSADEEPDGGRDL